MRNRLLVALGLALVVPYSPAAAIIMRHDRDPARYAALGTAYPAVGRLLDQVTCTLIAPRWALAAAHSVEGYFNPAKTPSVVFADRRYEIDKMIVHPERVAGSIDSSNDLALLHLREPVAGVVPVLLYDRDDEHDQVVTIVGYGETGDGLSATRHPRGPRYAAQNRVAAVFEHSLIVTFDTPPVGLDLEGVAGSGDSGGPALIEEDGRLYTLGVDSFSTGEPTPGDPSLYGSVDAFARVSQHRKWILDTMAADPPSSIALFGPYVRAPSTAALPDTPAGRAAAALLAAFDSGRVATMTEFYRAFGTRRSEDALRESAAGWQELFDQYGLYQLRGYREAGPYDVALFVRAAKGNVARGVAVRLDPDGEHRVTQIVMADVDEPSP